MPIMIRVTEEDGRKVWINASHIQMIYETESGSAIWFAGDEENLSVLEGPGTIDSLIDNALRYLAQNFGR